MTIGEGSDGVRADNKAIHENTRNSTNKTVSEFILLREYLPFTQRLHDYSTLFQRPRKDRQLLVPARAIPAS